MIIGVAGLRGSGKSLFGAIAATMGFEVFEMSEPILSLMRELGLEITNKSIREFAADFRDKGGADAVAQLLLPKIRLALQNRKVVIVIGVRSEAEVSVFKNASPVIMVGLISDEQKRFERIIKRKKPGDPQNFVEFKWADRIEAKWGIEDLLKSADIKIENNSSQEEFTEKVKLLLEKYK